MRFFGRGRSRELLERAEKLGLLEGEVVYLEKHRDAESLRDLWDKEVKGVPLLVHRVLHYLELRGVISIAELSREFKVKVEEVEGLLRSYLERRGDEFFVFSGWVFPLKEDKVFAIIFQLDNMLKQSLDKSLSYSGLLETLSFLFSLKEYASKISNSFLLEMCENKLEELVLRLQQTSNEGVSPFFKELYADVSNVRFLEKRFQEVLGTESGHDDVSIDRLAELAGLLGELFEIHSEYREKERRLVYGLKFFQDQGLPHQLADLTPLLSRVLEEQKAASSQYYTIVQRLLLDVFGWLNEVFVRESSILREQNDKARGVLVEDSLSFEEVEELMKSNEEILLQYPSFENYLTEIFQQIDKLLRDLDWPALLSEKQRLAAIFQEIQVQCIDLRTIHSRLQESYQDKDRLTLQIRRLTNAEKWGDALPLIKDLLELFPLSPAEKQQWKRFLVEALHKYLSTNYGADKKYSSPEELEQDLEDVKRMIDTYREHIEVSELSNLESYYKSLEGYFLQLKQLLSLMMALSEGKAKSFKDAKKSLEELRVLISRLPITAEYEEFLYSQLEGAKRSIYASYTSQYNGVNVIALEAEVLEELEKLIGETIPRKERTAGDFSFGVFVENNHVTHLSLSGKNLISLPKTIGDLERLQKLNISRNRLTFLPESLFELKSLRKLFVGSNPLVFIPEKLWEMTWLEKLGLWKLNLTYLPEAIGNLKNLSYLSVWGNQLNSLPKAISELKSLQILIIGSNHLTSLPNTLSGLISLKKLDISYNKLTSLPRNLINLRKLKDLNCDGNYFNEKTKNLLRSIKRKGVSVNCV